MTNSGTWFCGEEFSFTNSSSNDKNIEYECSWNRFIVISHALFVALTVIILLFHRCNNESSTLRTKWTGHSSRWCLLLTLLVLSLASVAEGILSDISLNGKIDHIQLFLPSCLFFIAIIVSLIYYRICESSDRPSMCCILLIYWIACIVFNGASEAILFQQRVDSDAIRIWITLANIFILTCLSVLEMKVIFSMVRSTLYHGPIFMPPPSFLQCVYVCVCGLAWSLGWEVEMLRFELVFSRM